MHARKKLNRVDQEPNSIAQEIFDELDETRDGEVCARGPRATPCYFVPTSVRLSTLNCIHTRQVTPQEYCKVARKHTARLTDEQCKEIIKLMDKGTQLCPLHVVNCAVLREACLS